ncbi:DUF1178 family protein [Ponticaulis koreensis]|uniref:DUF1178 family protein n=1 Tax=Ponticaulis koreensis TaxID=1123045 RepID=UPI0003B6CC4E|nr:DUF1178 family protein [Ponticaulis koreensis]
MVKYALQCLSCQSPFEAWFSGSDAFDQQKEKGLVTCPECGSADVKKQIMAPSVSGTKKRGNAVPAAASTPDQKMAEMMRAVRDHIASTHEYVGSDFARKARAMHEGEAEAKPVWGETTLEEAKELIEDGVSAVPLPEAATPAKPVDQKKLN